MDATPDPESAAALDKLFELAVRLTEVMQQGLGERALTPARAEVLLVLDQAGPMVQRELSEVLRCTARNVTTLVDALESQGLVKRSPHPTDRRATMVSLTKRGTAATARMGFERQQAARWLLSDVSVADLATFVTIADQVLDRIRAAGLSEQSPAADEPAGETDDSTRRGAPAHTPGRERATPRSSSRRAGQREDR